MVVLMCTLTVLYLIHLSMYSASFMYCNGSGECSQIFNSMDFDGMKTQNSVHLNTKLKNCILHKKWLYKMMQVPIDHTP